MPPAADWQSGLDMLVGERVVLREPVATDASSLMAELYTREVLEFAPEPPPTDEPIQEMIRCALEWRTNGRGWSFGIQLRDQPGLIGLIQFLSSRDRTKTVPITEPWEWGFALGSRHWGQGLFHEAGALALRFAFETARLNSVEAWVIAENHRADRALGKLGGTRAERPDTAAPDGRHGNFIVWTNSRQRT